LSERGVTPASEGFAQYPRFMEMITEVRAHDGERLQWTAEIHGAVVSWESVITVNIPNRRLAWRIMEGDAASGAVTTEAHGAVTQVSLQFTYSPEAPWAGLGEDETRALSVRALERFKELFESGELRARCRQNYGSLITTLPVRSPGA